jgi:hypothetical protein
MFGAKWKYRRELALAYKLQGFIAEEMVVVWADLQPPNNSSVIVARFVTALVFSALLHPLKNKPELDQGAVLSEVRGHMCGTMMRQDKPDVNGPAYKGFQQLCHQDGAVVFIALQAYYAGGATKAQELQVIKAFWKNRPGLQGYKLNKTEIAAIREHFLPLLKSVDALVAAA